MSGLRGVVAATHLLPKNWQRLTLCTFRNGDSSVCKDISSQESQFSTAACCLSSKTKDDSNCSSTTPAAATSVSDGFSDFDELINNTRRLFTPAFATDCRYRLISWQKKIGSMGKSGKLVNLQKVVSDTFPDVVEFSLTPLAPQDIRLSVLRLLLTQTSDCAHTERILTETLSHMMQLSINLMSEIVVLLSQAPVTVLRSETRRSMVLGIVRGRWHELSPKHLVFYMFQVDELFPVKAITQQMRTTKRSMQVKNQDSIATVASSDESQVNTDPATQPDNSRETIDDTLVIDTPKDGKEVSAVEKMLSSLDVANLESRAIALVDELKVKDLARVVSLLSRWGNRNEPLLSACMHRLSLADLTDFTTPQLYNLLQAMATLNLHNQELLTNLCVQLEKDNFGSKPSVSQVCTLLVSLSALRWTGDKVHQTVDEERAVNGRDLVKSFLFYLRGHIQKLTAKEAVAALTALANLAVSPSSASETEAILDIASVVDSDASSPWWSQIHCAWCLCVLGCLNHDLARKVLHSEFVQQVMRKVTETPSSSATLSAYKLTQVNMAVRLEVNNYNGPSLSDEQINRFAQQPHAPADQKKGKTALLNNLRKFVDLQTYVAIEPALPKGVTADLEMCANIEGDMRPLAATEQSEGEERYKLAIQYIPFSGSLRPQQTPTGPYAMTARHLGLLGYVPVQIFHSDIKPSLTTLEKNNNIQSRIKAALRQTDKRSKSTPLGTNEETIPTSSKNTLGVNTVDGAAGQTIKPT